MSDFEIIKAKISDSNKTILFLRQNFKIHNLKFNKEYFKNSFNDGIWFLSKISNKIVGVILLKIIKQDRRGELKHLVVHKNFRNQGIGKSLLNEVIKYAKKKKLRKLTGMASSNKIIVLKKLAENFKFKLEGILKNHYRRNEDVFVYSLFLQ